MSRLVTDIVVPRNLDANAKQLFADELYAAHCHIFDGADKKGFTEFVIDCKAEHNWIQVYRNDEGRIVGYFAVHVFEKKLDGKMVGIFTAQAGMMRQYRCGNLIAFGIDRVFRYVSAHPGRAIYYFGALIHPASYMQIARFADRVWPNPEHGIPANLAGLMDELSHAFGWTTIDEKRPLVRSPGWVTKDGAQDHSYWQNHTSPEVRFFLQQVPDYCDGRGLLTLVPLTVGGVVRATCRYVAHKAKRRVQAVLASTRPRLIGRSPSTV